MLIGNKCIPDLLCIWMDLDKDNSCCIELKVNFLIEILFGGTKARFEWDAGQICLQQGESAS